MRTIDDVDPVGVGMVLLPRLDEVVDLHALDIVEIEPQINWTAAGGPGRPVTADDAFLHRIVELQRPTLVHSVGLPLANAAAPPEHDLERLARDVRILNPLWVSEHLSFDRAVVSGEAVWTGFLLPPPQTHAAVRVAAMRLGTLREAVERPVAFETGVNYFDGGSDELSDGEFFAAVADAADCGILLDLHNLWANERNGRASVDRVVDALPLERVWEVHLAGGHTHRDVYLDAHFGLIDPDLLRIAERIVPRLPSLRAIILEAVPMSLLSLRPEAVRKQLDALRVLWTRRGVAARAMRRPTVVTPAAKRESDLLELSTDTNALAAALSHSVCARDGDRIALVAELVREARGGTLLRAIPLTSRLLLLELGADAFMTLFEQYAAAVPPERFPSDEGRHFLAFLERAKLDIPYLDDIRALERAMLQTTLDQSVHVVGFATELAPVVAALLERRRPPTLPPSPHVVRVRPGRISIRRFATQSYAGGTRGSGRAASKVERGSDFGKRHLANASRSWATPPGTSACAAALRATQ
jgi:uncharacterized protein (UPF0276 family)